ncbi:MAG TPA: hypothetical protein VFV19_03290 [Candidatus Polarisedimenticolaceae bacterium]|nr:hypothetical protein [Candidatus Polarisedimenticolaceae bacterium]
MRAALIGLALVLAAAASPAAPQGDDGGRQAAMRFGRALTSGKADALRPILPQKGKVKLTLAVLAQEDGAFAASQVEALFREFLAGGKVTSFEVTRFEGDGKAGAFAHANATVVDHEGHTVKLGIHLWLEPEGDRWVLREVKESTG